MIAPAVKYEVTIRVYVRPALVHQYSKTRKIFYTFYADTHRNYAYLKLLGFIDIILINI